MLFLGSDPYTSNALKGNIFISESGLRSLLARWGPGFIFYYDKKYLWSLAANWVPPSTPPKNDLVRATKLFPPADNQRFVVVPGEVANRPSVNENASLVRKVSGLGG